jgi:transposase
MAYSMDYRKAVARAYDGCGSSPEVAEAFGCSASWVRRLIRRRRLTGSLEPLPRRRPDARVIREAEDEQLRTLIRQKPDMTLAELAAALAPSGRGAPSVPTVWRATQRLELPPKKSRSGPPSRAGRT